MVILRPCIALSLAVLLTSCFGSGFSQTALSEEECTLLVTQIARITDTSLRDLSDEERDQALAQIDHSEAIAGCLQSGVWDRAGYECALLAQTPDDLNQCLMFAE